MLDSPSLAHAHSTPRVPRTEKRDKNGGPTGSAAPTFAQYPSPYEALKREMRGGAESKAGPATPAKTQGLPDMSMTPDSSPFAPSTAKKAGVARSQDPLLHRMLDKTYRVAATPLKSWKTNFEPSHTPGTANRTRAAAWADDSSPPMSPAPQLRSELFSPMKGQRTPGVSVRSPAKGEATRTLGGWDSDSEDGDELDFSPPKTMQFHIPQSRLLPTPGMHAFLWRDTSRGLANKTAAQEASKRIVEDLLLTAGGDMTEDFEGLEVDSPSL